MPKTPTKSKLTSITIRVSEELKAHATEAASDDSRSLSSWLEQIMKKALKGKRRAS